MGLLISKAFLLSGRDLEVLPGIKVRHPLLSEILDINSGVLCEELYWAYVSTIMSDPYDHMVMLDDMGIDYEKSNPFEVFVIRWNKAREEYAEKKSEYDNMGTSPLLPYIDAMSFFFGAGREFKIVKARDQLFIIDLNDENWVLNEDAFCAAMDFIIKISCIEAEDQIKPSSPGAKKILIEDKRMEEKKRSKKVKKSEDHVERIGDALATVFSGGAGTITPENYHKIHLYQLLSSARAIQNQMVVQARLNGIYCGMLKADKITDKELRWV